MDKNLIKKYRLDEAIKRYGAINEYIYETFDEAEQSDQQQVGGEAPFQGPMGNGEEMGSQPQMNDGNQMMSGDDSELAMDGNAEMGMGEPVDFNAEGMPNTENGMDVPQDDLSNIEQMQDGDEVIDVDDLTNAQEETEYKIDGVNDKLTKLMTFITKVEDVLNSQDEQIADLKNELQKRNPTPTEKLNLRSQSGYPFNIQPKDYWDKKVSEAPQYEVDFGNDNNSDTNEKEKYILRKGDIKGGFDRSIADSFGSKLSDFLNY